MSFRQSCIAWIAPLALAASMAAFAGEEIAVYVAPSGNDAWTGSKDKPFATLQRARDELRSIKRKNGGALPGPATVWLAGGRYELPAPVEFDWRDSGSAEAPVVYRAAEGEAPTLSGGRMIEGWSEGKDGRWTVRLPEVANGEWAFRQLYVGGQLRPRPRLPKTGFFRVAGFPDGAREVHYHTDCQRFEFRPGDIDPAWRNLDDVEIVVYHFWTDSHLPIQEIDTETNIVTFKHKAGKVFTDDFTTSGARYIAENVYEAMTDPGDWYLDRQNGVLEYLPKPGEKIGATPVTAPFAPALISLQGNPLERRFVEHISFVGLRFEHTNFELPPGNSNDKQGSASVPAAIRLEGARQCGFERCDISNLGTSAFEIGPGCRENRFARNRIGNVAASAFRLDGGAAGSHPLTRTGNNEILDNDIGPYGVVYPSAVGVLLMHTAGNRVAHNEIHDGYYTGVSAGWSWNYGPSVSRDNVIEANHIHHIGKGLLSDMGGVYTLGVSPGTVIRRNVIHDIDANHYGGWGIYHDEASSHILDEDNIVYRTKFAPFNIHYCKEVTVRNNIFAFGQLEQLARGKVDPHKSVFFEGNIVYWETGPLYAKNWKDKPYFFYTSPKREPVEWTSNFEADYNLYFNPTMPAYAADFNGRTWEEWQAAGKDKHSVWADPLFADPSRGDFTLSENSPALALGFRPIDLGDVGPRFRPGAQ